MSKSRLMKEHWVTERQTQTTMEKVDTSKELDVSSVIIKSNGTESQEQDTSSRSGNDAQVDDADIRPIYNEEPKAEVQITADDNVSATGQQYTEQPKSNNEGEVDQNVDQCYDTRPLPAKLTDNRTTKLSNQLLESENVCLKKTVVQCQKDFAKLKAHCINLELQTKNNVLKSRQLKNEQLHKEKEHLKQTYKDLFDSIKRTRVQTRDHNDSLMAQLNKKSNENVDVLAQIKKKGFAIAALKKELRKQTGNSVNTKFAKPSILGKPVLQPHRNQSVVRQLTAFKSERLKISKPQFASQVDVNNDLSKLVTIHYLPKRRESAHAKPHYMIAPSSSRTSTVHEKTTSPRSCLRWQPKGRIPKTVYLRWVPTGKIFTSSTTKVDSEPPNGSKEDITNQCESEQALDVSACTLLSTGTSFNPIKEGLRVWLRKRHISQKTGLQGILI
ncbi:hypothetical protein Tco_0708149 [Tanacetum coccineum]